MSASDDLPEPYYPAERRFAMFHTLSAEGVIDQKQPEAITEDDFNQIDSRLLLEDLAAAEAVSVEQMFNGWEIELAQAKRYSAKEMMESLKRDVARSND